MITTVITLASIGFFVSLYSYWVEQKIKNEPSYKPVCDLSDHVSCSKPMRSEYSHIFFFSNAVIGLCYYALVIALAAYNAINLLLVAAIGAACASLVLAYLLYVKVQSFCILCTALYIINFLILGVLIHPY